ncbi:MAG: hypothetical protein RLN60_03905 [Phycisphaerales bacterium]
MNHARNIGRSLCLASALALSGAALSGCDDGPAEEAGETVDEAIEDTADAVEDAADEIDGG